MKVPAGPVYEVAEGLICQCGCHLVLAVCPHEECPSRPLLVEEIQGHLSKGLGIEEVRSAMAQNHGAHILAVPPMEGGHILLWAIPAAALLSGALFLVSKLKGWTSQGEPSRTPAPRKSRFASKVEAELKEEE